LNILYIHQYFRTPEEGGAIRSYYIAQGMIEAGHEVDIITAFNGKRYLKRKINGFTVHYLPVRYYNHYGFLRRLSSFLLFAYKAYYFGRKFTNTDLAYITSTPLTVGFAALKLRRKEKIPYVFEVRDLWPEAPIQLGAIRGGIFKLLTRKLEIEIYRRANKIITLSPGIFDHISKMFPDKPIHFCPNFSDCEFFEMSDTKNESILKRHKIGEAFVISYFGAVGKTNALEYLLEMAKISDDTGINVRFLLIGDGSRLNGLKKLSEKLNLRNFKFIPHMNKYDLKAYLSVTDAAYISFANYPIMELNSPNKFFDALASGKLIITNTRGWIKEIIEKNECGFYIDPTKPDQFLTKISPFLHTSKQRNYQHNSRYLAESTFEKRMLIKKLLHFISN
jgi:glycosyltransferase involved in cell wall biosynthesis